MTCLVGTRVFYSRLAASHKQLIEKMQKHSVCKTHTSSAMHSFSFLRVIEKYGGGFFLLSYKLFAGKIGRKHFWRAKLAKIKTRFLK